MTLENPARRRPVETDLLRKSLRDSRRTWKTLRVSHSSHRPHDDDQVLIHHSGGRYYRAGVQIEVGREIRALASTSAGDLWIQAGDRIFQVGSSGLIETKARVSGILASSGAESILESDSNGRRIRILGSGARFFPFLDSASEVRALAWSSVGFFGVIDDSLFAWSPGESRLAALLRSPEFRTARDVAPITRNVAVVALARAVLIASPRDAQVLVAGFPARVRYRPDGTLFMLDERTGALWEIAGAEALVEEGSPLRHAEALLSGVSQDSAAFDEAVRAVGCEEALRLSATELRAASESETESPVARQSGSQVRASDEWSRMLSRRGLSSPQSADEVPSPVVARQRGSLGSADLGTNVRRARPAELLEPGPGVTPPVLLSLQRPTYPEAARQRGIEGDVVVRVLVDEMGRAASVVVDSGVGQDAGIDEAALLAAQTAIFRPASRDGDPGKMWFALTIPFRK